MSKFKFDKDLGFLKDLTMNATKGIAKYPVISECPVCHHDLEVVKLQCTNCETTLEGRFTLSKFNYLDTEKLYFIEVFMKNKGNIKMVEKEMGLSYPTIKKMLDEVVEQLGYSSKDEKQEEKEEYKGPSTKEILEKVDKGEITADEAAKLLAKIK
ncbi:DUF2089 domain-containing protein [Candidatus Izemoplasma sp. B36]|uniref:DUF2089 domain-containing protein n=1 Tax=Candidatus Izemoplasma sp. B36 TaxID=3242468 RepID=UPI003558DE36